MGAIVYAEDDPSLRAELIEALQDAGFEIIEAGSGDRAIEILRGDIALITGLITDINLGPGADGWEVARLGRELKAALSVVYVSAQSQDDWPSKGVPNSEMIEKPLVPNQVVVALSMALNSAKDLPKPPSEIG